MGKPLSPRREAFCQQYVLTRVGTKAAERAGYSPKSAAVTACGLLKVPEVKERIKEIKQQAHLTEEDLIRSLDVMARGDWTGYIKADEEGRPVLDFMRLIQDGYGWTIQGFATTQGGVNWKMTTSQDMIVKLAETAGILNPAPPEEREANLAFKRLVEMFAKTIKEE